MRIGDRVEGRYVLEAVAGAGGMGTVYAARDLSSGVRVALKVVGFASARALSSASRARFAREVKVLAQLSHPSVVRYLQHGLAPDGRPYLAMEWLEGEVLSSRLTRAPLTVPDTMALFRRVAEALASVHAHGVVHRDIKPSNLFLAEGAIEGVKLIDFGLARIDGGGPTTATGQIIGTPEYMAPEQARGSPVVDARADVFSLGCVLFRALTGKRPFDGEEQLAILSRIVFGDTPRARALRPEVPDALDDLLVRMLAKLPDERPADGAALVRELDALVASRPGAFGRADAISATERRFVNVVAVAPPAAPRSAPDEDTRPMATDASRARVLADAVVRRYGGTPEWLVDGSMVGVLRPEGAATDRAAIAARCALQLASLLPGARVALATGKAEVTEREALGEALDRAAALVMTPDGGAGPSAVRLDEASVSLLSSRFEVSRDLRSFVLGSERAAPRRPRTLLGRPAPFVGRERELGALLGWLEVCVRERRPVGVLVTGPAGAGKSRLREELLGRPEVTSQANVWRAQADPIAGISSLAVVRELLGGAASFCASDAPASKRAALRGLVSGTAIEGNPGRALAFLAEVAGVPLDAHDATNPRSAMGQEVMSLVHAARQDPAQMADQTCASWVDLMTAVARERPVVLVVEDLHWGDPASVRFLDALLRDLVDRAVFVLALARPEVHTTFPRLWEGRHVEALRLGPLPSAASRDLARQVLGPAAPAATVDRVVELSLGNAFFLEELLRSASAGQLETFPESVMAMVEARLEKVAPDDRRVLRAASVFGKSFWAGGVEALLGAPDARVGASLDRLTEAEVVRPRQDSSLRGQREYAFVHELVRQCAYGALTREDRTTAHRLCAEWLRRQGQTSPLLLAEHLERGDQRAPAAAEYVRAAREADGASDFSGVLTAAERGLRCECSDTERAELLLLRAEVLQWEGELEASLKAGTEAMARMKAGTDDWYAAAADVVFAAARAGREGLLARTCASLLEHAAKARGGHAHLAALARTIPELVHAGYKSIADAYEQLLDERLAAGPVPSRAVRARVHAARAQRALARGDLGSHHSHLRAAVAHFEEAGDVRSAYAHLGAVGFALLETGQLADAERLLRRVTEEADQLRMRTVATAARRDWALAVARQGRFGEALAAVDVALGTTAAAGQGDARLPVTLRIARARVALWSGDAARAHAEAAGVLASGPPAPLQAYAHAVRAEALMALGRVEEAARDAAAAFASSRKLGGLEEGETLVWWVHARAHQLLRSAVAKALAADAKRRLAERAATLTDESHRAGFLTRVAENAALAAM